MRRYVISKIELHKILRTLGALQANEEIKMISNFELFDSARANVGFTVSGQKSRSSITSDPTDLTNKELQDLHIELVNFEIFLLKDYAKLRECSRAIQNELERRQADDQLSSDGIPKEVDERLSELLKDILENRNPPE